MKIKMLFWSLFGLFFTFFSCKTEIKEPDATLKQAMSVHEEAIAIEKTVAAVLDSIEAKTKALEMRKANAKEETIKVSIDSLLLSFQTLKEEHSFWKEGLLEVPGMEHSHGHDHHHHHHGDNPLEGESSANILTAQEEFKANIEGIRTRTAATLEKTNTFLKN